MTGFSSIHVLFCLQAFISFSKVCAIVSGTSFAFTSSWGVTLALPFFKCICCWSPFFQVETDCCETCPNVKPHNKKWIFFCPRLSKRSYQYLHSCCNRGTFVVFKKTKDREDILIMIKTRVLACCIIFTLSIWLKSLNPKVPSPYLLLARFLLNGWSNRWNRNCNLPTNQSFAF